MDSISDPERLYTYVQGCVSYHVTFRNALEREVEQAHKSGLSPMSTRSHVHPFNIIHSDFITKYVLLKYNLTWLSFVCS